MALRCGFNSPTQGYTDRARQAAEVFGPEVMLWLPSAGPQDAVRYPACVQIVRCPNWAVGQSPVAYAESIAALVVRWRSALPGATFQLGNEPDIEAGHHGEEIEQYAAAVHATFPGIAVGNPPLSVEQSLRVRAEGCEVVLMHSYFERQHPESMADGLFGRSYLYGTQIAAGRPVYVTECNVVQTNCPIDWPDRNAQAARWLDQMEADGVAGACFFLLDGQNEWASFDVGPEAAAEILARRGPTPVPVPPPPPPPPSPFPANGYRRDAAPRSTADAPLSPNWLPAIQVFNAADAPAIVAAYADTARAIGYDPNLEIAQGWVETGGFDSPRWRLARNAAGIGIYANSTPDVQFGTIERGIEAQADLLNDYFGDAVDHWGVLREFGFGFDRPLGKTKLSEMDGVWAADSGYSAAIVAVANKIVGTLPRPTSGVTGDDIAAEALSQLGQVRSGGYDTHNGDHPWYLWCQSFVERVHEHRGITGPFYTSAYTCGLAMVAQGRMRHDRPRRGGVLFFDLTFWSDGGHTMIALGDGTAIGTTGAGIAIGPDWTDRPGYMGWAYRPGVNESIAEEIDVHTDGKFDDGRVKRLWDGPKTRAASRAIGGYDGNRGIDARWMGELKAGRPLGYATSKEERDAATGVVIRYFSSGFICWYPADGSTTVN